MMQSSPDHFEASGSSPTEDRIQKSYTPTLRQTRKRQELIAPLAKAVVGALPVVFEKTGGPEDIPSVRCRWCDTRAQLSPFRVDCFEFVAHEPDCDAGRALKRAGQVSSYPEPRSHQVESAVKLVSGVTRRLLVRMAKEQGIAVSESVR